MNTDVPRFRFFATLSGVAATFILLFVAGGCGSSEPTQEDWEAAPEVSPTARLEYRIDSLQSENRRMKEQVNAMAAENRSLTAKNAELETKLTEAAASPAPAEPASGGTSVDATSEYSAALSEYKKRDFAAAIQGFESLLNASVSDELADNCHYWLGESYYGLRKYSEAIKHFNEVLGYQKSEKKADAQLMIGNSYAAMGQKDAARKAYDKVVSSYPSRTQKAQEKLARLR
ncbi:tetratricopeptide repeat protein [bacterium]|nr:MAG: tetratricopeptide repeat protein [bacterium]